MNTNEIVLTYFAIALIVLISIPIFHEGIHIFQNRDKTLNEICFLGIDDDKSTMAWVSVYNITNDEVKHDEEEALIPTIFYGVSMVILLLIGLWKSEPDY